MKISQQVDRLNPGNFEKRVMAKLMSYDKFDIFVQIFA